MYGKSAPKLSGRGACGYYRGIHFRSLLEVAYLKYLFDNKIEFKSAETNEFAVSYADRTYRPDFYLIESGEVIEVKPKRLVGSKENILKFSAASEKYGDKFRVVTDQDFSLSENELKRLIINNKITFNRETKWVKQLITNLSLTGSIEIN